MSLLARFGATEKIVGNGIGTLITAPYYLDFALLAFKHSVHFQKKILE